ncbi:WAS/WASL-interacting protein family member 1-like [Hyaena hyaena]|uniref:WAS/WASL-interacting protein family member 1-like n=1 Tax=Hyaena hyaena TaxID=95912 RepID=UPI001923D787|nr:WAS/WASL-interacting protein family member 1-like [Hyaena hyaena]
MGQNYRARGRLGSHADLAPDPSESPRDGCWPGGPEGMGAEAAASPGLPRWLWTLGSPQHIPPFHPPVSAGGCARSRRLCGAWSPAFQAGPCGEAFLEKCGGKPAWEADATRVSRPGEGDQPCLASSGTGTSLVAGTWPHTRGCQPSSPLNRPAAGAQRGSPAAQAPRGRRRERASPSHARLHAAGEHMCTQTLPQGGAASRRERPPPLWPLPPREPETNLHNPLTSSRGSRAASPGTHPPPLSDPGEGVGAGTEPKEEVGCPSGPARTLLPRSSPAPAPSPFPSDRPVEQDAASAPDGQHVCCAGRARRTASTPAVRRRNARASSARKQNLRLGPDTGLAGGREAAGAGAPAGFRAQLRSRGSRCRRGRDARQRALPSQPQDLFSINCLRDPLAGGFLSNTVFYKLRRPEEDATAARRLPTLQKVPRSGSADRQPAQWVRGSGRGVSLALASWRSGYLRFCRVGDLSTPCPVGS